jgi:glutamate--cysteine ligase
VPFRELLRRKGCEALKPQDFETHLSTIFTDVRAYTYIEVRTADLQPDDLVFAVPAFWTGILYGDDGLAAAAELGRDHDDPHRWAEAMHVAARRGIEPGSPLREPARRALAASLASLRAGAWRSDAAIRSLERLAERRALDVR